MWLPTPRRRSMVNRSAGRRRRGHCPYCNPFRRSCRSPSTLAPWRRQTSPAAENVQETVQGDGGQSTPGPAATVTTQDWHKVWGTRSWRCIDGDPRLGALCLRQRRNGTFRCIKPMSNTIYCKHIFYLVKVRLNNPM